MRAFTVTHADIATCPHMILSVEHWREDGTCKCTTVVYVPCPWCQGTGSYPSPGNRCSACNGTGKIRGR